jgi:hypothetical protein
MRARPHQQGTTRVCQSYSSHHRRARVRRVRRQVHRWRSAGTPAHLVTLRASDFSSALPFVGAQSEEALIPTCFSLSPSSSPPCHIEIHTQSGGVRPFGISTLVIGFDDGKPRLFQTDPSGTHSAEWKVRACRTHPLTLYQSLARSRS